MNFGSFKTSVNIKFDIGDPNFIHRYLPTPSHGDALLGLSQSFSNSKANAAHIMVGPYGSGKSLLATLVANIVTNAVKVNDRKELANKFEKVHQEIYESLLRMTQLDKKYIAITLNGNEGRFDEAILRQVMKALNEKNIDVTVAGIGETIENTINGWKVDFNGTYQQFITYLQREKPGLTLQQWLQSVNELDPIEIKWFSDVYKRLTSGAKFEQQIETKFIEQLELVLQSLRKENIGLFIIYDEFGRYLQSLEPSEINKAMQDIQDIAEFVNRTDGDIQLLLISHKSMSQYMLGFTEEYRSEFQRVEKRYKTYFVESDTATYYRVVDRYVTELAKKHTMQIVNFEPIVKELRVYNLFRELNSQEVEKLIVEGSYPIHPVSLFLLPRVSKVFGQNERTLFTFLESTDTGGLRHHIVSNTEYYYPHHLFDYFFKDFEEFYLDELSQSIVKTYKKNIAKIDSKDMKLQQVLKLVTMWQLTNSNSIYPLSKDLVQFSLGFSKYEVEDVLQKLIEKKVLRYNRVLKQIELYEGSSVVLDEIIDEAKSKTVLSLPARLNYIQSHLPQKYFLATDYNDYYNITRFMRVKVMMSTQVLKLSERQLEQLEQTSREDGFVYFILLENQKDVDALKEKLIHQTSPFVLYVVSTVEWSEVLPIIDADLAISTLLEDKQLLLQVDQLKEELLMRREELKFEYEEFIQKYYAFTEQTKWIYKGKQLPLRNIVSLESFISDLMEEYYAMTPLIMNDGINRFHVKGVQKRAVLTVIDQLLSSPWEENIGIQGQGPDYLAYATIFKNNDIYYNRLTDIKNPQMAKLREKVITRMKNSPEGKLSDLIDIFKHPPFGIRPPLIPVLFVGLLRDQLDQMMYYRNDMFVPVLKSEVYFEMFQEPEGYTYIFHDFHEEELSFLKIVEDKLIRFKSEYVKDKTILIQVSSILLNWVRSLPKYVQTTQSVTKRQNELKRLIRYSEVNPLDSFTQIYTLYNGSVEELFEDMRTIESFFELRKNELQNRVYDKLKVTNYDALKEKLKEIEPKVKGVNRLLKAIDESNSFERFIYAYMGVLFEDWSDVTYEVFESQIKQDIAAYENPINHDNSKILNVEYNGKYKQVEKVDLSEKAKFIQQNVERILNRGGQRVPKKELENIIMRLVDKYIE